MRLISFSVIVSLALLLSAALAQQSPGTTGDRAVGDTIGHPPPLPGPPPISEPSPTTQPAPAASTPGPSQPAPKGYTGAYGPPGPATPYYKGPLPEIFAGTGRAVVGPDGSTKIVKAVPCSTAAHGSDGSTTCLGIPEQSARAKKNR